MALETLAAFARISSIRLGATRTAAMRGSTKSGRRERGVHEPTSAHWRSGEFREARNPPRTEHPISSGTSVEPSAMATRRASAYDTALPRDATINCKQRMEV